ncbi:MAG: hypothetical protein EAZ18_09585 [Oscillatoriales cyanobacterium]|nr:MAG: hypothetical protein EAZ18_09585 [Oscillatoriales cyanobacterium]
MNLGNLCRHKGQSWKQLKHPGLIREILLAAGVKLREFLVATSIVYLRLNVLMVKLYLLVLGINVYDEAEPGNDLSRQSARG